VASDLDSELRAILIHTTQRMLLATITGGRRLDMTSTPLDTIVTIQWGTILLFSWFAWTWAVGGRLETCQGLHHLENLPYKFRNIVPLRLLLPGEEIRAVVFRPGIWGQFLVFFRRQTTPV
jgi:hypothetical protein